MLVFVRLLFLYRSRGFSRYSSGRTHLAATLASNADVGGHRRPARSSLSRRMSRQERGKSSPPRRARIRSCKDRAFLIRVVWSRASREDILISICSSALAIPASFPSPNGLTNAAKSSFLIRKDLIPLHDVS